MDVLCSDEDLFEDLSTRQTYKKLYEVMDEVLSERERMVVTLRYGLGDRTPLTQRGDRCKVWYQPVVCVAD